MTHLSLDDLRLVNGVTRCSGRVEVLHRGQWGTVCDNGWDLRDATVVCRELGCGEAAEALKGPQFGQGSGGIWMKDVECVGSESTVKDCKSHRWGAENCGHHQDAGVICSDGLRLVNGSSRCSGRVEVLHRGQWGTVCDNGWDLHDAAVVCRELGCGESVEALKGAQFGQGSGNIWMKDVQCVGSESTVKYCMPQRWGAENCGHHQDAGVICSGVQLVGRSHCSGRVELLHKETRHTVCNATFDQQDAEVVCRQLGCGAPVEVLGAAAFGEGEDQVWSEEIQCGGNETQIHLCPTSPMNYNCSHKHDIGLICEEVLGAAAFGEGAGQVWSEEIQCGGSETQIQLCPTSPMNHNCSHDRDQGLVCSGYTDARLANGSDSCSGRVEIKYLREWGTVCDASWDMRASSVLCHQLQCGSAVAVVGAEWFGSSLSQYNGTVRLSGERRCEGAVEVYVSQRWRRVLLDSWSQSVVSVVCRQLACGSAVRFSGSTDTEGDGCVSGIHCSGRESHLGNCSSPQIPNCTSSQQVTVVCSGPRLVRLTGFGGDCAGRLEVLHNGSWGTVCDDSWDMQDAQVVCRQLQCGTALSAEVPASIPPGDLPIWLSEVNCTGDETSLWECPPAEWGRHDCSHKEDVRVMCSEFIQLRQNTERREPCSGVIEVYYNGTWGNICSSVMDKNTGSVICYQLGCGRYMKTHTETPTKAKQLNPPRYTGTGTNPHIIHKESVKECPELRLVGGPTNCSGRVEVLLQGGWGTVCDDSWDKRDAQVVCRQLDCGEPVREGGEQGSFGKGNGPIWLDEVNCTGHEHHLWECCRAPLNQSDCIHKEDAWVTCTGPPLPPTTPPPVTPGRTTSPPCEPAGLPVSPAAAATLGLLLLLLLGSLVVLLGQNRALRRALSKRQHVELIEAVYEELDHRLTTAGSSKGRHRARLQSDAENSWYEDVQEDERRPISVASQREPTVEYDDVAADENETILDVLLTGEAKREEYDDVEDDVTSVEKSSEVTDYIENTGYDDVGDSDVGLISESLREEGLEDYDDITTDENGVKMTKVKETKHANEKEQEYYDDIMNEDDLQMTSGVAGMMTADQDQEYDGIITGIDYDDVGAESEE
ncbi:antigen WC1.1-like [Sardina pilchardus]|uniref:antigen WC1.1-like n=1 Tax=Sardina pilchardus TaxID=27697 RepID=UPI002E12D958